jgi:hypothetical protein
MLQRLTPMQAQLEHQIAQLEQQLSVGRAQYEDVKRENAAYAAAAAAAAAAPPPRRSAPEVDMVSATPPGRLYPAAPAPPTAVHSAAPRGGRTPKTPHAPPAVPMDAYVSPELTSAKRVCVTCFSSVVIRAS